MNPIPEDCEANNWLSCMVIDPKCKVKPVDVMIALEKEEY